MLRRIQMMNQGQRIVIFALFFGGGLLLIVTVTVFLILLSFNSSPREQASAVLENAQIQEFITLPDDNAYPAAVAVASDGTIYTGSYDTGAIWSITLEGTITELPNTRELIGAVTGLAVDSNDVLYILDRLNSNPQAAGGMVWRIADNGLVVEMGAIDDATGFVSPHAIELDTAGNIYVSDRGRRQVWRLDLDNQWSPWWTVPTDDERAATVIPTGLGYDAVNNALLITDAEADTIYKVGIDTGETEILYRYEGASNVPGFDGITVLPDGRVFAAAFAARKVVEIRNGDAEIIADGFRGGSDVAYYDGKLYVTNFDQRSLVLPGIQPQLPFALDVITLP